MNSLASLDFSYAADGISLTTQVSPRALGKTHDEQVDNLVTILDGYFNMMMITDASACEKTTGEIAEELNTLGEEIGVNIRCQHEDIFNKMHRI